MVCCVALRPKRMISAVAKRTLITIVIARVALAHRHIAPIVFLICMRNLIQWICIQRDFIVFIVHCDCDCISIKWSFHSQLYHVSVCFFLCFFFGLIWFVCVPAKSTEAKPFFSPSLPLSLSSLEKKMKFLRFVCVRCFFGWPQFCIWILIYMALNLFQRVYFVWLIVESQIAAQNGECKISLSRSCNSHWNWSERPATDTSLFCCSFTRSLVRFILLCSVWLISIYSYCSFISLSTEIVVYSMSNR